MTFGDETISAREEAIFDDDPFPPALVREADPTGPQLSAEGFAPSLNLWQRLHAIMTDVSYIQKGQRKVNNQYPFVSHDQVMNVIHPALVKHRVLMVPKVKSYVCLAIGDPARHETMTEVVVDVAFVNVDQPEERHHTEMVGFGFDNLDKGPGKAISYAVKYAILKVFALETGEDPDQDQDLRPTSIPQPTEKRLIPSSSSSEARRVDDAPGHSPSPPLFAGPANERTISEKQVKFLWVVLKKHGMEPRVLQEYLKEHLGIDEFPRIPMSQMESVLKWIQESANPF